MSEGRKAAVIKDLAVSTEVKQGSVASIINVSIDMSPAYIAGVPEHLPQAKITFDKCHVTALLSKAMDDLIKLERRDNDLLKGHKYTVLTNYTNLSIT